jgi:hypothetical protein
LPLQGFGQGGVNPTCVYLTKKFNHEPHEQYSVCPLAPVLLSCFSANEKKIQVKSGLTKQKFVWFCTPLQQDGNYPKMAGGEIMKFVEERILNDFDSTINRYLVFLVHVQRSTLIQVSDKLTIFDKAKNISVEIKANVQNILNNISKYNVEEKRKYIEEVLLKIEAIIINEINSHGQVKIYDRALFLLNNITENLMTDVNGIKLSRPDISNMYSYKELNMDREKEEYVDKEMYRIKEKLNVGLEEIKRKAFLEMLYRNNKNPERFHKINNFILEKCRNEEIKLFVSKLPETENEGLFFIIDKRDLTIRRQLSDDTLYSYRR